MLAITLHTKATALGENLELLQLLTRGGEQRCPTIGTCVGRAFPPTVFPVWSICYSTALRQCRLTSLTESSKLAAPTIRGKYFFGHKTTMRRKALMFKSQELCEKLKIRGVCRREDLVTQTCGPYKGWHIRGNQTAITHPWSNLLSCGVRFHFGACRESEHRR